MRPRTLSLAVLLVGLAARVNLAAQDPTKPQGTTSVEVEERIALHRGEDWGLIAPHLPDPATASEESLETAGDVLKARRFPEDAIDYYQYAMKRGGNSVTLMKKMGVVRLELQQNARARAIFQRCVDEAKNDSQAWNNLAAADYTLGSYRLAVAEYKRAVKLNKRSAVYHANLGMAYFSINDAESARAQFTTAMRLDPNIMGGNADGGVTLHVVQTKDFGQLCFEMARMYVAQGRTKDAELWLQKAGEHGLDVRVAISDDAVLRPLLKDPEFRVLLSNGEQLHRKVALSKLPTLGTANDGGVVPE